MPVFRPWWLLLLLACLSACHPPAATPGVMASPSASPGSEGAILVQVMSTELQPLAGVSLRLSHPLTQPITRLSDAEGRIQLPPLDPGFSYRVELSALGMVSQQRYLQLPLTQSALRLRFFLTPALGQLALRVLDAAGRPLPGAVLDLGGQSVESDAKGQLTVALAEPLPASTRLFKQGYAPCQPQTDSCRFGPIQAGLRLRLALRHQPLGQVDFGQQLTTLLADTRAHGYDYAAWIKRGLCWIPAAICSGWPLRPRL
jgi:hypothetical protein